MSQPDVIWLSKMCLTSSPFPEKGKKNKKVLFCSSHLLCSVLSPFIRLNARRHWVKVRLSAVIFLSNVFSPDLPFYFHGFSLDIAMNSINCGLWHKKKKRGKSICTPLANTHSLNPIVCRMSDKKAENETRNTQIVFVNWIDESLSVK